MCLTRNSFQRASIEDKESKRFKKRLIPFYWKSAFFNDTLYSTCSPRFINPYRKLNLFDILVTID